MKDDEREWILREQDFFIEWVIFRQEMPKRISLYNCICIVSIYTYNRALLLTPSIIQGVSQKNTH